MKKTIITLSIFICSIAAGFSQTFNYELKSWSLNGSISDAAGDSSNYPVIVQVGIVDEPYGFVPPNVSTRTFVAVVSNLLNKNQIEAAITAKAIAFVAKTYPNVK